MPYPEGVRLQTALAQLRAAEQIPDVVLFLEHEPVVTLGNRGRREHLKQTPAALAAQNILLAHSSRGGDVTFHGPGQLVMYPILKLGTHEADARGYLFNLEETAITTCAAFGVGAWRRQGLNGAWTDQGKIAAIGFRIKRWVTMHGMSFNVAPDLRGFQTIVPCGLAGQPVTSLQAILGAACPTLASVRTAMAQQFSGIFNRPLEMHAMDDPALPAIIRQVLAAPAGPDTAPALNSAARCAGLAAVLPG